jgi:two-component system, HptB-dependent secretion and biofilm response regulator
LNTIELNTIELNAEQKKSRILVVDDDEILNFLFCSYLESKQFSVVSAAGVAEAKNILQSDSDIDLMLLDYQLTDGVGMDLLAKDVVVTFCKPVPTIMISANEEPEFLEQCFMGGVSDYIIKPVNLSLLALKVDALIKSVALQQLVARQKNELEIFKAESEREEQVAKFTYEYLLGQYSQPQEGVQLWLKSFAAFSGDMSLAKKSPSGSLYFMQADATGHGLSAAITIMPVLGIFSSMVSKGFHVQQIVAELNRKLLTDTPADRFIAASVIEISPFRNEMCVWNGSMPSVYWVNDGQVVHEFKSRNMALGILDADFFDANIETINLPSEGFIFTYTDGLSEQENHQREAFSAARILNIIEQKPNDLLNELALALEAHAQTTVYDDDVSMCVINPSQVFPDFRNALANASYQNLSANQKTPFSWHIHLSGKTLGQCDIPPLCNHFLQQIGYHQVACQKIFVIVAEMVSNAIDHGVLNLSSAMKEDLDGFIQYYGEREERLKNLTENDFVSISLLWNSAAAPERLIIEVEDSGIGFVNTQASVVEKPALSGRGTDLIKKMSESVEVFFPGNKIRAIVR